MLFLFIFLMWDRISEWAIKTREDNIHFFAYKIASVTVYRTIFYFDLWVYDCYFSEVNEI